MCGIAGIYRSDATSLVAPTLPQAMTDIMTYRGPNSGGAFLDWNVGLGVRRLSIIDLADGDQPIANEDGTCHIVFNGEIYNHRESRDRLLAKGHRFSSRADTEAILHLYEERGTDCVHELQGMFAFAIFDQRNRRLFLARDRLGIKPMYYAFRRGTLVFGSEIKSLLQWEGLRPKLDFQVLGDYLSLGYVPGPRTLFAGIQKLPGGHWLTFDGQHLKVQEYWDVPVAPSSAASGRSEESYLEELEALLRESVRKRLMADVPLGAFLSGGLDSSLLVALMSEVSGGRVKTFSVGFEAEDGLGYDERSFARIVAERFDTDHREFVVRPRMMELLPKIAWHLDEPVADPATVPTYLISELAAQSVTVVLSGEGGDELFGGYQRYWVEPLARQLDRLPTARVRQGILDLLRHAPGRTGKLAEALSLKRPADRLAFWNAQVAPAVQERLLSDDVLAAMRKDGDYWPAGVAAAFDRAAGQDLVQAQLYTDQKVWLADDLLVKADKMSMAHSLEARVPFLDHKLVEFAASVPFDLKLRGLTTKHLLRRLGKKLLPAAIWQRRKHGFNVPLREWFVAGQVDEVKEFLANLEMRRSHLFRPGAISRLLREHVDGRADHSRALWNLMNLECWLQAFLDGPTGNLAASPLRASGVGRGALGKAGEVGAPVGIASARRRTSGNGS